MPLTERWNLARNIGHGFESDEYTTKRRRPTSRSRGKCGNRSVGARQGIARFGSGEGSSGDYGAWSRRTRPRRLRAHGRRFCRRRSQSNRRARRAPTAVKMNTHVKTRVMSFIVVLCAAAAKQGSLRSRIAPGTSCEQTQGRRRSAILGDSDRVFRSRGELGETAADEEPREAPEVACRGVSFGRSSPRGSSAIQTPHGQFGGHVVCRGGCFSLHFAAARPASTPDRVRCSLSHGAHEQPARWASPHLPSRLSGTELDARNEAAEQVWVRTWLCAAPVPWQSGRTTAPSRR